VTAVSLQPLAPDAYRDLVRRALLAAATDTAVWMVGSTTDPAVKSL
jgi:hypothetical protein